ncbi:MAG: ClpXP protease specificity-enhancing factor SspB [Thalassobaculales bacterium]
MKTKPLQYDRMVEDALRQVVRRALSEAAEKGLPGEHHFYITFRTGQAGVEVPDYLRQKYPGEMTIVLQYQFWGLEVAEDHFKVTLSFSDIHERLVIPYAAIVGFADPSVKFGLQFQLPPLEAVEAAPAAPPKALGKAEPKEPPAAPIEAAEAADAKVVTLDRFRRK